MQFSSLLFLAGLAAALPSPTAGSAATNGAIFVVDDFAVGTIPHTESVSYSFAVTSIPTSGKGKSFSTKCETSATAPNSAVLVPVGPFDCGKGLSFTWRKAEDNGWTLKLSHKNADGTVDVAAKSWTKEFIQVLQFGAVQGAEVQQSPRFFLNSKRKPATQ